MPTLTISQALKLKKKVINQINVAKGKVQHNNRFQKETKSDYDVNSLIATISEKTDLLIKLKVAIQKANEPVLEKIYRLSELKDTIKFYRQIPTGKGRERISYHVETATVEWDNQIGQLEVDKRLEALESEIETIQEELDTFNHTTRLTY